MPSSHLVLSRPLLLLPPVPPSIKVFSNESTLHMRWPKYWSFSFSIIPSKEIPGLISFRMDWLDSIQKCNLINVYMVHYLMRYHFVVTKISYKKWHKCSRILLVSYGKHRGDIWYHGRCFYTTGHTKTLFSFQLALLSPGDTVPRRTGDPAATIMSHPKL